MDLLDQAIAKLTETANEQKAAEMKAYHKVDRPYWGVANPVLEDAAKGWRQDLSLEDRLVLADALWQTNVHEARICAAKLLTQARIRPDDTGAWDLIQTWVPDFDAWAIADHVSIAGQKRLVWDTSRLDTVESWTQSDHMWTRRAALVMTLPWTKKRDLKPADQAIRDRILGWAEGYVPDHEWFIQKAIGWWLRDLSKRDPDAVTAFIDRNGNQMKRFAVKEALRLMPKAAPQPPLAET